MGQITRIRRNLTEISAPFYRTHLQEIPQAISAKWLLAKHRVKDSQELLRRHGFPPTFLSNLTPWKLALDEAIQKAWQEGVNGAISWIDGEVLYGVVRAVRPEVVIETGVAAGISSSFLMAALVDNESGELFSVELPPDQARVRLDDGSQLNWAEKGVGWAIPSALKTKMSGRYHLVEGNVLDTLPKLLRQVGEVGVFFHDDLHTPHHMLWEYRLVWPFLAADAALISDDVNAAWIRFGKLASLGPETLLNVDRLAIARKISCPVPSRKATDEQ